MKSRPLTYVLYAILLLVTAAVYSPALRFQFGNWDDRDMVVENPNLHPPTAQTLRQIWTSPYLQLYTPLSYSLWWGVAYVTHDSPNPLPFHLLNILLHLTSTLLVFSILLRCVKVPLAAFAGAAIFALHPMQVETVAWVAELNNAMAAALSLAAIRFYIAYADRSLIPPLPVLGERDGVRGLSSPQRWAFYAAASLCFVLALLAKPIAVVVPFLAAIFDRGLTLRSWGKIAMALLPWILPAILFALVAHQVQPMASSQIWYKRLVIASDSLGFYLRQVLCPIHLSVDYARTPLAAWTDRELVLNAILPPIVALMLWSSRKSAGLLCTAGLISVVALLPVLGFIPFNFQNYSTVADRYVYVAMLGPALAIAWALAGWRPAATIAAIVVLVAILASLTWRQLQTWRDSDALADHTLQFDPNSTIANRIKANDLARLGRNSEAVPYYVAAMRRNPQDPDLHLNLANAYFRLGQYDQAVGEYQIITSTPNAYRIRAMLYMGWAFIKKGEPGPARQAFLRVLELDPGNTLAQQSLNQLSSLHVPTP